MYYQMMEMYAAASFY